MTHEFEGPAPMPATSQPPQSSSQSKSTPSLCFPTAHPITV